MKPKQLTHNQVKNNTKTKEIVVITEDIRTPENIGMLFRISEAFGVKKIFLVGDSPNLNNKKVLRTARKTERELNIKLVKTMQPLLYSLKKENYFLLGLEHTNNSKKLKKYSFSTQKIALFIGAERFGISENTLKNLDGVVHIELFGKNSSVNVVNALSICLYEINR
jgi:tRNA G18 (ribose-2'-O)-methylase SpoU